MPNKTQPRRPPKDQWQTLPRTKAEARHANAPYWFKRDKSGQPIPCQNNHIALRTADGDCVECKKASDARERYKKWHESKDGQTYFDTRKEQGLARGSVPGYRAGYSKRVPSWLDADDISALKAMRTQRPDGMDTDHIVDPNHYNHENAITGLESAQNLQYLTRSDNQKKGSYLPDPGNYKVKAGRPLTKEEMRVFVRAGMAVWSKDVSRKGNVKWKLYRREADRTITYLGDEPELLRTAAE